MSISKLPETVEVIAWKMGELTVHDLRVISSRVFDLGYKKVVLRLSMSQLEKIDFSYRMLGEYPLLQYKLR